MNMVSGRSSERTERSTIAIDHIEVDVSFLYAISHECRPGLCRKHQCCCSSYDICINGRELATIIGYLPDAVKFAPHLDDGSGFENMFEEEGPNLFSIDNQDECLCVFAYENEKAQVLCSLHSTALDLNLPPHRIKPGPCVTWPLALSEEEPLLLSIAEDAFDFPCNAPRDAKGTSLDPNLARIVRDVFGGDFLLRLEEAYGQQRNPLFPDTAAG